MNDIRQTQMWANHFTALGWEAEKIGKNFVYIKKLPFFGSYIKIPRCDSSIDMIKVLNIAKEKHAFFIKIEPKVIENSNESLKIHETLIDNGFIRDYFSPTIAKTIIVNLDKNFRQKFDKDTRYCIRKAKQNGILIRVEDNFELLFNLYKKTAERKKFPKISHQKIYGIYTAFKQKNRAKILVSYKNLQPMAGCLLLFNQKPTMASYFLSGSEEKNFEAPYLMIDYALQISKKFGCKYFDFEGIQDHRYFFTRDWEGFSSFKKGFGGNEVSYLGSYLKTSLPILKNLMTAMLSYKSDKPDKKTSI